MYSGLLFRFRRWRRVKKAAKAFDRRRNVRDAELRGISKRTVTIWAGGPASLEKIKKPSITAGLCLFWNHWDPKSEALCCLKATCAVEDESRAWSRMEELEGWYNSFIFLSAVVQDEGQSCANQDSPGTAGSLVPTGLSSIEVRNSGRLCLR
ncbi:hypothetical protein BDR22DRAFT_820120 [Usnea florida]